MDIKTLPTILGHVSSATTLNTYSHITDEMRQRAAYRQGGGRGTGRKTERANDDHLPGEEMVEPKGKLNDADRHAKIKERKMCCKNDCFRDNKQFSKGIVR